MAKNRRYKQRKTNKKKSYASRITQLARDMGAVDRGRKNPDSKVSAAYNQGNNAEKHKKRTLF